MANTKITSNVIADGAITESKLASGVGGVAGIVSSADATAITIDSSENVGIGITNPSTRTHIYSSASSTPLIVESTANTYVGIKNTTQTSYIGAVTSNMIFENNGSERMRISSAGNLGINTTSPASLLDVRGGNIYVDGGGSGGASQVILTTSASSGANFGQISNTGTRWSLGYGGSIGTVGTEVLTWNSSGNVGIGTTSPDSTLHVKGAADAYVTLEAGSADGNTALLMQNSGGTQEAYLLYDTDDDNMQFGVAGAEKMRITSGDVIVGDTVVPNGSNSCFSVSTGGTVVTSRAATNSQTHFLFMNPNGGVGSIRTNASATAFNTSSDARLKDITGSARGLEVINALNPVSYNWKADGKADEGLIAQEVLNIVPNAVSGSEEEYYQMDYSKLVTPLVKAIQEQQEQIEQLKTEIQTLKGE